MPGTIDDFIDHFTRGDPIDDDEVEQYRKRFVSGNDPDFDLQTFHESVKKYLRKLPDDGFQHQAGYAVSRAKLDQRQGLLGELLSAADQADIADLRLGSTDPHRMSVDDAARLMNYARRKHLELLTKIVEEKRWSLKELVDPVVVGALAITAKRLRAQRWKAEEEQHRKAKNRRL